MSAAKEIEIKFAIADLAALDVHLGKLGFTLEHPRTYESNTLYDFPDLRLRSHGELLRIRRYGDTYTVTHKAKGVSGRHKSREETETSIGNGEQLANILAALGLQPSFLYEKFRALWTDGKGHVAIDETPIGNFGEIEGEAGWIDVIAQKLGLREADYITESYGSLFYAWKARTGSAACNMRFVETAS